MRSPVETWELYKKLLGEKRFADWGQLWAEKGRFEVAFPREQGQKEVYNNREDIVRLVGGNSDVEGFRIFDDKFFKVVEKDVFFVQCKFEAIAVSGYRYETPMVLQVTLSGEESGNMIEKIIEYPDPRAREAFFQELECIARSAGVTKKE